MTDHAAIVHAFLERYAADQEADAVCTLDEYERLWPGYESVIREEFARLQADGSAAPPRRIAHYAIEGELGRGAQGVVYHARDTRLDRVVALKVLRRRAGDDVRTLLRFRREALAASRLDHPGICTVYESGVEAGATYLAMRFVPGETVAQRIAAGGEDDPRALARLFAKAATALHAAHGAGIVHRDLKPGNIMVTPEGEPVLLDFGLAGGTAAGFATLTATGDLFGTPAYMAPEQISPDGRPADARTDVYALGVSLFEAATGRRAFHDTTVEALFRAILAGESVDAAGLPRDLQVILATAMERAPERRYASAAALAEDLRRFAAREPILARPAPVLLRLRRWSERNPGLAAAVAGLFLVISTALGVTSFLLRESERNRLELAAALEDARLGRSTKRARRVEDLLQRGFQAAFSADPRAAPALFEEALELDPANGTALAGRLLAVLPDRAAATAALARHTAAFGEDPVVAWLSAIVAGRAPPEDGSTSDLRAFLEGHLVVRNFQEPLEPEALRQALDLFRTAAMRAPRPRFHHFHSWMMSASRLGDRAAMEEAQAALTHHWPDVQATWETVAQFWFPYDGDRAVAAMRRVLELGPSAAAHLGIAMYHQTRDEMDDAFRHYDTAIETDPTLAIAPIMRAMAHERSGRGAAAAPDYARGLELGGPGQFVAAFRRTLAALDAAERERILAAVRAARPDLAEALR